MPSYLTIVHALSALHAGTGQGSGTIDLPIAREKATGLPYLPGSSLKGTLRTHCAEEKRKEIFGSENAEGGFANAGMIQISDQRLLLLPVRSLAGTFAWVTSPYVLRRLKRDLAELNIGQQVPGIPQIAPDSEEAWVVEGEDRCALIAAPENRSLYLEELDLTAQPDPRVTRWAEWLGSLIFPDGSDKDWQRVLLGRLCIVHDDILSFLLKTGTEVTARIRLEEQSKTVIPGALWYEEALPAETILSGLALTTPELRKTPGIDIDNELKEIVKRPLQLGGKSTVGRGLCRVHLIDRER
jgi:CRISPR-associated protein Cmr4